MGVVKREPCLTSPVAGGGKGAALAWTPLLGAGRRVGVASCERMDRVATCAMHQFGFIVLSVSDN